MDNARHICAIRLSWFEEGTLAARRGEKVYIEKCKTSEQQRMLLHNGFKMYNDLPREVRREQDCKRFRERLEVACNEATLVLKHNAKYSISIV